MSTRNKPIHSFIIGSQDLINIAVGKKSMVKPFPKKQQPVWKRRLLKVFQVLGLFPCDFVSPETSCGLKPMKAKKYLPILVGWIAIYPILYTLCYWYTLMTNPKLDLYQMIDSQRGYINTFTDYMASNAYVALTRVIAAFVFFENFCISRKLPDLWNYIDAGNCFSPRTERLSNRFLFWSLSLTGIISIGYGMGWYSILSSFEREFGLEVWIMVLLITILTLQQAYLHASVSILLILFGDTICKMTSWCTRIKEEVLDLEGIEGQKTSGLKQDRKGQIIKSSFSFLEALEKVDDIFGRPLLGCLGLELLNLVLTVFLTVSMLFDPKAFTEWNFYVLLIGFNMTIITTTLIIAHPPNVVHHLEKAIKDLARKLNLVIHENNSEENMVRIDNRACTFEKASMKVINGLKTFDGISACNFFKVKRSLLTSIMAHFTTYFIILLQFRVTEYSPNNSSIGTVNETVHV